MSEPSLELVGIGVGFSGKPESERVAQVVRPQGAHSASRIGHFCVVKAPYVLQNPVDSRTGHR